MDDWLKQMKSYLQDAWGLSGTWAAQAALLYLYLWYYGLNPQILSGFRSREHQADLQRAFDAGATTGLQVRPATDSLHSRTAGLGSPAAIALDIRTSDPSLAGQIAKYLGIGWGGTFSVPDTHHFFDKKASEGI